MEIVKDIKSLRALLTAGDDKAIGFVPTMGALHKGHLSLLNQANEKSDITVVSIFVNPKQFNKQGDFDNYPKSFERDAKELEAAGCDILFCPEVQEMYPDTSSSDQAYDFGQIAELMEGEHRPGHFNGVAIVIKRFFDIIQPDFAFFGEKDFQQLAVVRALVEQVKSEVKIIGCPTVREKSGLAMSSRNERLTTEEKQAAAIIYTCLSHVSANKKNYSVEELKRYFVQKVNSNEHLTTEYFEIANAHTLQPIKQWQEGVEHRAFAAVNIRDVRLIDNVTIID